MSERILVTGPAGFIDIHLSKSLLDDGCEVLGLDNLNDYSDLESPLNCGVNYAYPFVVNDKYNVNIPNNIKVVKHRKYFLSNLQGLDLITSFKNL